MQTNIKTPDAPPGCLHPVVGRNVYTFHREDGWYPIELVNDIEAAHHVLFNPGTIKVVNETTGKIVFDAAKPEGLDCPLIEQRHNSPNAKVSDAPDSAAPNRESKL